MNANGAESDRLFRFKGDSWIDVSEKKRFKSGAYVGRHPHRIPVPNCIIDQRLAHDQDLTEHNISVTIPFWMIPTFIISSRIVAENEPDDARQTNTEIRSTCNLRFAATKSVLTSHQA